MPVRLLAALDATRHDKVNAHKMLADGLDRKIHPHRIQLCRVELQVADGLARLALALCCEYVADLGIWWWLELEGYNLTNV